MRLPKTYAQQVIDFFDGTQCDPDVARCQKGQRDKEYNILTDLLPVWRTLAVHDGHDYVLECGEEKDSGALHGLIVLLEIVRVRFALLIP